MLDDDHDGGDDDFIHVIYTSCHCVRCNRSITTRTALRLPAQISPIVLNLFRELMRTNGIAPEDLRGMGVQCSKLAPCPPPSTGGTSNAAQATLVPSSVSSVAMDIRNAHDNDMDDSCCAEADAVPDFDDNDDADAVVALPADDDHGQVSHPSSSCQSHTLGLGSMPVLDCVPSSSSSAPADAPVVSLSHSQEEFLSNLPPELLGDALEQLARSATVCRDHQIAEKLDAEAVDSGGHIVLSDHGGWS